MSLLSAVRVGFVLLCLYGVLLLLRDPRRTAAGLKTFFCEAQPPINLGLLRVIIFSMLLLGAWHSQAAWFAALPRAFVTLPPIWDQLGDAVPLSPHLVERARQLLVVTSLMAVIGLFSRMSALLSALLAIYVFGVENFYFKLNHAHHVPVLSALVLAASPCGDAVSVDAWFRRLRARPAFAPSPAYVVPVRLCWLLQGTMYLFPGLWKLWKTGDLWLTGTKLRVEMFDKWAQMEGFSPLFRADRLPWLLSLLGIWTLLFEIGFFPALFSRTTRVIAALHGFAFHLGVGFSMGIWFNPFHPLTVLLDFPQLLQLPLVRKLRSWAEARRLPWTRAATSAPVVAARVPRPLTTRPTGVAAWIVGSVLVASMLAAGVTGFDSWPVGVYPRFASRTRHVRQTSFALSFVVLTRDGARRDLKPRFTRFQGDSASVYRIARKLTQLKKRGDLEGTEQHLQLLAHIVRDECGPFEAEARLLIYRHAFPIDPEVYATFKPDPIQLGEVAL